MKKKTVVRHRPNIGAIPFNWILRGLGFGILTLIAALSGGAAVSFASPTNVQGKTATVEQAETTYIPIEEENAYRAAKQEPDPGKRAEKLYAFAQKYPKSLLIRQADLNEIQPVAEEYGAYYAATHEPDLEKRGTMQINFLQKYPKSHFNEDLENEFMNVLKDCSQGNQYDLLISLAERWVKLRPEDRQAYAFIAEAAIGLQNFQKAGENLEIVYKLQPSSSLAREILYAYQKADNVDKQVEWGEKLFKMPEFDNDYMLRFGYVSQFVKRNDLKKAAEYARLTIKSAEAVKPKDEKEQERLQKMRRACHHVIASELFEEGNYAGAIAAFQEALKDERYAEGYFKIGQCLDEEKDVENATHYYAMAELMGGEDAQKAKARLEVLYKALHNDTLVGIEKVYKKAKESLAESDNKS